MLFDFGMQERYTSGMDALARLEQLRKKMIPPQNPNVAHQKSLSKIDKLAIFVTNRVGTMGFFFIIFGWTLLWLSWNTLAPAGARFDPAPAFVLWLFISNLIQIHLMPLIMIGQNLQGRHAELRGEHDYQTDKKAEKEIEAILLALETQQKTLSEISKRLKKLEGK